MTTRIVANADELGAVKAGEISLGTGSLADEVDMYHGVKKNGSRDRIVGHGDGQHLAIKPPEPAPFPVECLPGPMREITEAVARQEGIPPAIAACCALGVVSAAVGKRLRMPSLPEKTCSGNLYILCAAPSGSNKSETCRVIAKPLHEFEAERIESWGQNDRPDLLEAEKFRAARIKAIEKQLQKDKPADDHSKLRNELRDHVSAIEAIKKQLHPPRLLAENVTSEALGLLLERNDQCSSVISADAREVIDVLSGRYQKGGGTDEGIYLKGFSLEPYYLDRVIRAPLNLREICISCLWLVQPDKLQELVRTPSLSSGGLLPRFLVCQLEFVPAPINRNGHGIEPGLTGRWQILITSLVTTYRLARDNFKLSISPAARDLLYDHCDQIRRRLVLDLKPRGEYAKRWNEQAWRLCVVLHAAEHGANAHEHEVSEQTARNAIQIAEWFASEQMQILGASRLAIEKNARVRVLDLAARNPEGIALADVYHARITPDAETARCLLNQMINVGSLRCVENPKPGGGWKAKRYFATTSQSEPLIRVEQDERVEHGASPRPETPKTEKKRQVERVARDEQRTPPPTARQ